MELREEPARSFLRQVVQIERRKYRKRRKDREDIGKELRRRSGEEKEDESRPYHEIERLRIGGEAADSRKRASERPVQGKKPAVRTTK